MAAFDLFLLISALGVLVGRTVPFPATCEKLLSNMWVSYDV